ncbi:MAG TPA: MFS transporter [Acetobacteraceae bacterium]|nr:MFS transporter [Acetobacteraceae bacterium]
MTEARRLSLVLGLTQTLAYVTSYYVPAVVTASVARDLGASPTLLLGGFSWAMLVAGFISPRVGAWIDRAGGRGVLALGKALLAAGLVAMSAVTSPVGWYVAWTVMGLGMGLGLYDAAFATIGRLVGGNARSVIVGVSLIGGFASSIGWAAGAASVDWLGWRATLLAYAAINLAINLPLVLLLVPAAQPAATEKAAPRAPRHEPAETRRSFVLLSIFFSARSGILAVVSVHILYLLQGLGLSAAAAVGTAALIGPAQVAARIAEWSVMRWTTPLTISRLGAFLLPLGVGGLLIGGPVWAFAVSYGVSNGVLTISRGVLPLYLFGTEGYAARIGRLALPSLLTAAAAPTLVTPLVLAFPAWQVLLWGGVLSFAVALCLIPLRDPVAANARI